jgi:hypothetical protein
MGRALREAECRRLIARLDAGSEQSAACLQRRKGKRASMRTPFPRLLVKLNTPPDRSILYFMPLIPK